MSVKQGGIASKSAVPAAVAAAAAAEAARQKSRREGAAVPAALPAVPARLCVEDPLTGRDLSGGTHRINQVI